MCLMAVPNEHTFPHLATLGDCSIKTALRWLKTKHWIGKYIGMHPGMSLALATFTNHSPKLPYLSNCITLVKIFFWKHRVNFVHYVLLPTEQAETYLKIYYLKYILTTEVSRQKKQRIFYGQADRKRLYVVWLYVVWNRFYTRKVQLQEFPTPPHCRCCSVTKRSDSGIAEA